MTRMAVGCMGGVGGGDWQCCQLGELLGWGISGEILITVL